MYFFIGDGPMKEKLLAAVDELNLENMFKFYGRMPHDRVLQLLQSGISVLVHPSIETGDGENEGIPVSLMGAMAAGIPVISTTTGGIPELLEGGAGILVPPEDSKALADAIETIMNDPASAAELGLRGRKKVESYFSLSAVVKQLTELFENGLV